MSFEKIVLYTVIGFIALIVIGLLAWRLPKRLRRSYFVKRWNALQQKCVDSSQWTQAIIEADDLLGEALKKRRFKGGGTGERLVSAQKQLTNNDVVWFGHKLRTKIDDFPDIKLAKDDVQKALLGIRQGLKDIGAL